MQQAPTIPMMAVHNENNDDTYKTLKATHSCCARPKINKVKNGATHQSEKAPTVAASADYTHDGGAQDDGPCEDEDDQGGHDEVVVVVLFHHVQVVRKVRVSQDVDGRRQDGCSEQLKTT